MDFGHPAACKYTQWDGPHKVVPYLAPTVILRAAGIGMQLSYAYHQNATPGRTNSVYSLQTVAFWSGGPSTIEHVGVYITLKLPERRVRRCRRLGAKTSIALVA
jgi:hypothetical protein